MPWEGGWTQKLPVQGDTYGDLAGGDLDRIWPEGWRAAIDVPIAGAGTTSEALKADAARPCTQARRQLWDSYPVAGQGDLAGVAPWPT
jgi:hypothetical protein